MTNTHYRFLSHDVNDSPNDMEEQIIEAAKELRADVRENTIWRRTGGTLDLLKLTDSSEMLDDAAIAYRMVSIDCIDSDLADALEVIVSWLPVLADYLERERPRFSEEHIVAAARAKFLAEYPLGRKEAGDLWEHHRDELLHSKDPHNTYGPLSRYEEAKVMLKGVSEV